MILDFEDVELFFKLQWTLMAFVNQLLRVISSDAASPEEYCAVAPELQVQVRDALTDNLFLIDAFVDENPAGLSDDEIDIVRSWRHLVAGKFYIFLSLKKHTVFLSTTAPPIAYGVLALSEPFEAMIEQRLPVLTRTVLLPFKGMIVYDGLMQCDTISFGPRIRGRLGDEFEEAKTRHGTVTSLPMSPMPLPPETPKRRPAPKATSKQEKGQSQSVVIGLIDRFCKEHLNEEYAVLCRKLAEKLGRKRPSPLLHGSPNAWASGIVRAVGAVNFLHDKSQTPYLRSTDIDHYFRTSSDSGAARSTAIRKMFKIRQFDPNWTLPSKLAGNPFVWMLQINGFMIDVRKSPGSVQEIAFNSGLIPYIPADRQEGE